MRNIPQNRSVEDQGGGEEGRDVDKNFTSQYAK